MEKRVLTIAFIGAVLVYFAFALSHILGSQAPDFSVYYQAVRDFQQGINPYLDNTLFTAYNYPPVSALPYLPLVWLPYRVSQTVFLFSSVLALFGTVYLAMKLSKVKFTWLNFGFLVALAVTSFPVKFTLGMGQINLIAGLFLLLGLFWCGQQKPILVGAATAMAIILKPILAIFFFYFVARKNWPVVLTILAIILAAIAASLLLITNGKIYGDYFTVVLPRLADSAGREVYYNQSLMGFLSRLTTNSWLRLSLNLLLMILILTLLVKKLKNGEENRASSLLITFLLITNSLTWQHHLAFLIWPFIYALSQFKSKPNLLVWLGLAYLLVSANIRVPAQFTGFPASLLLSHGLYGGVILLVCLTNKK